jgi:hypothetical protein
MLTGVKTATLSSAARNSSELYLEKLRHVHADFIATIFLPRSDPEPFFTLYW